jgi:hypothetical protein
VNPTGGPGHPVRPFFIFDAWARVTWTTADRKNKDAGVAAGVKVDCRV